jgi:nucleoside-diphosphate-sugar epimerase
VVRNDEEADIAQQAVINHSRDFADSISLVRADLTLDDGWKDAVKDCACVLHIAAPYPMDPPRGGREVLVPISRDGTVRILKAAFRKALVQRVMMVSSLVAMLYWPGCPQPAVQIKETDWTDPDWTKITRAYTITKSRAEKAAWDFAKERQKMAMLVSVNPGMVWGPLFDSVECTSSDLCKMFLRGTYPLCLPVSFPIVDVRDVAALLVAMIQAPNVGGGGGCHLLAAANDTMDFNEIGKHLAESFPGYAAKIPTHAAPRWLMWLAAFLGDTSLKQMLPNMETRPYTDSSYVTALRKVKFRPSREAVFAMAASLCQQKLV